MPLQWSGIPHRVQVLGGEQPSLNCGGLEDPAAYPATGTIATPTQLSPNTRAVTQVLRGVIGVIIGVAVALAYAALDALLGGAAFSDQLTDPVFWVVTIVCAIIAGLVVMDIGSATPKPEKSRDRIAGEQLLWSSGIVVLIGILISLVTRTSVVSVFSSLAFWIPAGFAILAAALEPYRGSKKKEATEAIPDAESTVNSE